MTKKITLETNYSLPSTSGEIIADYLYLLQRDTEYDAWTIGEDLNVVKCVGIIQNNGAWNYHNNYDDSQDELYIKDAHGKFYRQWFTLNKDVAIKLQKEIVFAWKLNLETELQRVNQLLK